MYMGSDGWTDSEEEEEEEEISMLNISKEEY